MTVTEKRTRARQVRADLARFVDLQGADLREWFRAERGIDPDEAAMGRLVNASKTLAALIADLQAEDYGEIKQAPREGTT
jgi:hypothetical protein